MAVIDESQLQLNSKVLLDLVLQNAISHNQGQLNDSQEARRRQSMLGEAFLVQGVEKIHTVDPAQARGLRSLGLGEAVDTTSSGAILTSIIMQAIKAGQSTRPESGAG